MTLEFESCVLKQFQESRIFVQSIKSRIHFQPNIVFEALLERFQCARTVFHRQQGGGTIGGTVQRPKRPEEFPRSQWHVLPVAFWCDPRVAISV
jgi:hypothetical protein